MLQSGMVTEGTTDVWIRGTIVGGGEEGRGRGATRDTGIRLMTPDGWVARGD